MSHGRSVSCMSFVNLRRFVIVRLSKRVLETAGQWINRPVLTSIVHCCLYRYRVIVPLAFRVPSCCGLAVSVSVSCLTDFSRGNRLVVMVSYRYIYLASQSVDLTSHFRSYQRYPSNTYMRLIWQCISLYSIPIWELTHTSIGNWKLISPSIRPSSI